MLSIDRHILEKKSLDNALTAQAIGKNSQSIVTNQITVCHTKPSEMTQKPQNEAHIDNALRA